MKLPLLISIPHAGRHVPPEIAGKFLLTAEQLRYDGDEGASEIYDFAEHVTVIITTDVARTVIDVNRSENDRRADGVFKSESIFREPIWRKPLTSEEEAWLLQFVHRKYHAQLSEAARRTDLKLAIDCHTMCDVAPPTFSNAGEPRPMICLGDLSGASLPQTWLALLARLFEQEFDGFEVAVNRPFAGGHITRTHSRELPWVQLEVSRTSELSSKEKRAKVLRVLTAFCAEVDALFPE